MQLFTVAEVAKMLKTNVNTVYNLNKAGLLKFMKLGSLKCTEKTLRDFLETYDGYDVTDPYNVKELRK